MHTCILTGAPCVPLPPFGPATPIGPYKHIFKHAYIQRRLFSFSAELFISSDFLKHTIGPGGPDNPWCPGDPASPFCPASPGSPFTPGWPSGP